MSISPQWLDERKKTIVITYEGHWTWDEFQDAVRETNSLMNTVDHDVVLIHDTLSGSILPPGNIITQGKTAISGFSNNLALIVVVLNSSIIRTFLGIITSMNPSGRGQKIKAVSSLEEAYQLAADTVAGV